MWHLMVFHELFDRIHSETKQQIILKLKVPFQTTVPGRELGIYKEFRRGQNEEAQFAVRVSAHSNPNLQTAKELRKRSLRLQL